MVSSIIIRTLKVLSTSVACSLPVILREVTTISDKSILLISFFAFLAVTVINIYKSAAFHKRTKHFYVKKLLPLCIYFLLGAVAYLIIEPNVFNMIFLPLRFAESFSLKTIESIIVVAILIILATIVSNKMGAKAGKSSHKDARKQNQKFIDVSGKSGHSKHSDK